MNPPAENTSDREIVISRILSAPRELVWQAWTEPQHVANWWGPRGFTTTIKQMDFRVGGVWEHVMHGPDGTDYPNKSTFTEIVPLERITYAHAGGEEDVPAAVFTATWTFEAVEDDKTRLTGRMVFPSKDARDFVAKEFGAIEGGKQTLERASEYVAEMQCEPFVITREFNTPRDVVWRAWTERESLIQWFGPKGFTISEAKLDLRPGGLFHYSMQSAEGRTMWGRFVYREIVPPKKLVWVNSFSDPDGGLTRHPLTSDPWPLEILTTVTFAERDGCTILTVKGVPLDSTVEERRTFNEGRPSMTMGWTGTLERLETFVG